MSILILLINPFETFMLKTISLFTIRIYFRHFLHACLKTRQTFTPQKGSFLFNAFPLFDFIGQMTEIITMTKIIPFASGKGGVGKSLVLSNLGLQLSRMGRTVILMDLDLGAANLHTFLGLKNNKEGLGYLIHKKNRSLESLVYPTDHERLFFIPGDNLLPDSANYSFFIKRKLLSEIQNLTADYILLDLGAGSCFNTLDYFTLSEEPFMVVCPEPTSILNAYSFLKSARARQIFSLFPANSPERKHLKFLFGKKMEGTEWNFSEALIQFRKEFPSCSEYIEEGLPNLTPRILINMGRTRSDLNMTGHLRTMCKKNLSLDLQYIGFIHYEESMHIAVKQRKPYIMDYPEETFSTDIKRLAQGLETLRPKKFSAEDQHDLNELQSYI